MCNFTDFPSANFHEICTEDVNLWGGESFKDRILKIFPQGVVLFKKGKFWAKIFNDFWLQAPIIP